MIRLDREFLFAHWELVFFLLALVSVVFCGGYVATLGRIGAVLFKRSPDPRQPTLRTPMVRASLLLSVGTLEARLVEEVCSWYDPRFLFYDGSIGEIYTLFTALLIVVSCATSDRGMICLGALPLLAAALLQLLGEGHYGYHGIALFLLVAGSISLTGRSFPWVLMRSAGSVIRLLQAAPPGPAGTPGLPVTQYRHIQGVGWRSVQYHGIGIYTDTVGTRYKGGAVGSLKKH